MAGVAGAEPADARQFVKLIAQSATARTAEPRSLLKLGLSPEAKVLD
jgi:hypothetical protein